MTAEPAGRLALALAIGLLVGLERGWRERNAPDRSRTAGIRTYGISGLLGGIFALLSSALAAPSIFVAGFLVYSAVLALYKLREAVADSDYSVTAVVAGLGVFALGGLAIAGDHVMAAAGGAALAAVLASREVLHGFLKRLTWEELRAALILAVMTAIVLPLLPDRTIDPWNGLDPRQIWLFTILVATLSYAGYVANRVSGSGRGLLLTTLLGAIISSTAMTVALARRSREAPATMAGAAALAAAVSVLRVCIIVLIVAPRLWSEVIPPAAAAVLVFIAYGIFFYRGQDAADGMDLKNPFDIGPLLAFAASFAVIAAVSAYLTDRLGAVGMIATSAVSAVFDVDVAVLTALRQLEGGAGTTVPDASMVTGAILAALVANAFGRASLAALAGNWRFSLRYVPISLLAAAAGATVFAIQRGLVL